MKKSFYIIDGSAYVYRAYFAIRELSTSSGLPTNAIYGFAQMLLKLIKDKHPDYLAITFDTQGPTTRHSAYAEYKSHRPEMPDSLQLQIPYIHRLVEAFQIPSLMQEGVEADDLIGTLSKKGEAAGLQVVIVSGDKDMFQLITPSVTIYDSMKEKVITEDSILEKFGVTPPQMVEIMGLMGDTADNIPGVRGIGKKTAIQLIGQFGSIDHLLENLDQVKRPKLREMLASQAEEARLSRSLVTIDTDCPIDFDQDALRCRPGDPERLIPLFRELEFSALIREFQPSAPKQEVQHQVVKPSECGKIATLVNKSGELGLEFLSTSLTPMSADWVGIALVPEAGRLFYLSLEDQDDLPEAIKDVLASHEIVKVGHNLKPLLILLKNRGISLQGRIVDTMIPAYLLNPDRRDHSIEAVALELLNENLVPMKEMVSDGKSNSKKDLNPALFPAALCKRADAALRLSKIFPPLLEKQSLTALFSDIEVPLVTVLADIERNGVKIDTALLGELSRELEGKISALTETIHNLAGEAFNVNSPKQLAYILFEKIGLTPIKKTKTGFSTNEEVLTQLAVQHPLPAEVLSIRQLVKLKSTYVDALPRLVHPETQRVHTQLNQTITATGRLSSKEPNLQNIPIRGEIGKRIRGAFTVEPGHCLLSADYSQIELRILAHMSEDPQLLESFQIGEDVHTRTAIEIFGLLKEEITSEMRRAAKAVNFGIIYGQSPFGLSAGLGVSMNEAKRYIDLYFEHYHGVRLFIDETLKTAAEKGYVTTLLNRRRQIRDLASPNSHKRGMGERMAINTPIQGSAADIIKLAMIAIWRWMREEKLASRMTLQVHDELIFEVPLDEVDLMKKQVVSLMEGVVELKVPLTVDIGTGQNWSEAH
ncbi:MAG: DNA polymerase I [Nitrospiria bacterium]